jgi:hypothetical protein
MGKQVFDTGYTKGQRVQVRRGPYIGQPGTVTDGNVKRPCRTVPSYRWPLGVKVKLDNYTDTEVILAPSALGPIAGGARIETKKAADYTVVEVTKLGDALLKELDLHAIGATGPKLGTDGSGASITIWGADDLERLLKVLRRARAMDAAAMKRQPAQAAFGAARARKRGALQG